MYLYALDAEVERLIAELSELTGAERIAALVTLAWYLRQRDSQHASMLADEAEDLLSSCVVTPLERQLFFARLALVRAEVAALLREFVQAEHCLREAKLIFFELADKNGEGDAQLVASVLFLEQGDIRGALHASQDAATCFAQCADSERQNMAEGWTAYLNSFSVPEIASASIQKLSVEASGVRHPALAALMTAAQGEISYSFEKAQSSVLFNQASDFARQAGLIRLAIMSACNAGAALQKIGDFDGAALIYDWAVSRARESGWPAIIAFSLIRLGELLRDLNRLDQSERVLREALQGLKENKIGIHAAIANAELGNTLLSLGEASEAATYFDVAIQHCRETGSRNNLAEYLISQARALATAGEALMALDVIDEARILIDKLPEDLVQVDLREALAEIHHLHELPGPPEISAPNVVLHYLEDAVAVGNTLENWQISAKLLLSLAEAWARAGDGQKAFEYAKQAIAADQRERSKQTENWATLMQVRHETETAKAVAIHHQQLSAASLETSQTLGLLGKVGQEITANLNFQNVCDCLQRHLGRLLNTANLSIWLIDSTHQNLELSYCVQDGTTVSSDVVDVCWDAQSAASCIEHGQELLLESTLTNNEGDLNFPKTCFTLFCPLMVGDAALGVMAIRATDAGAYSERQRLIFRSLCAYGAIALDNAKAHHELQLTQAKLEQALLELKEASFTDPLTGLRNRRFLMQNIEADIALSIRNYQNTSADSDKLPKDADLLFFLVDLDYFKQINDRYGHAAGDAILVQIRARLQKVFRDSDYLIRWGGEEFLVVARGASRAIAEELAERVRAIVADEEFNLDGDLLVRQTCSVGFACFPFVTAHPRAIGWKDVMDIADIALYAVKHAGRNGWMGLIAEEHVWPELLLCTLKADPKGAILNGEVRLATNMAQDAIHAGLDGKKTILLQ